MLHFPYWNTHIDKFNDFVDEVGRWDIRLALVDNNPERLLGAPHATNRDLNTQHHQHLTDNAFIICSKREIIQCNETRDILLTVDYGR